MLPLALFGVFAAVLGFLADPSWLGTLAALAAVVTLWAFRTLYAGRPATPDPGRDAGTGLLTDREPERPFPSATDRPT